MKKRKRPPSADRTFLFRRQLTGWCLDKGYRLSRERAAMIRLAAGLHRFAQRANELFDLELRRRADFERVELAAEVAGLAAEAALAAIEMVLSKRTEDMSNGTN